MNCGRILIGGQIAFDNSRIWRETGFEPLYRIETGIEQYVGWLRGGA